MRLKTEIIERPNTVAYYLRLLLEHLIIIPDAP